MHPDSIKYEDIEVGEIYQWIDGDTHYIVRVVALNTHSAHHECICLLSNRKYYPVGRRLYMRDIDHYIVKKFDL